MAESLTRSIIKSEFRAAKFSFALNGVTLTQPAPQLFEGWGGSGGGARFLHVGDRLTAASIGVERLL